MRNHAGSRDEQAHLGFDVRPREHPFVAKKTQAAREAKRMRRRAELLRREAKRLARDADLRVPVLGEPRLAECTFQDLEYALHLDRPGSGLGVRQKLDFLRRWLRDDPHRTVAEALQLIRAEAERCAALARGLCLKTVPPPAPVRAGKSAVLHGEASDAELAQKRGIS